MTVLINGRSAVHTGSNGTVTTQDDCYTGPQQQIVTYQNIAKSKDAQNTAKTVFINGQPVCHKKSYFAKSYGSEAGDGGGVKSGTVCDKAEFKTASSNVFIEGVAAVRQNDLMISNHGNTPPAPLIQKGVPYGGDQNKINHFPKVLYPELEFDLSQLPLMKYSEFSLSTYKTITLALNGNINMKKDGEMNPLIFDLKEYKVTARQSLSSFCNFFSIISANKNYGIGSNVTGEYWSTRVELQNSNKLVCSTNPQPLKKQYNDWLISGELGFTLTIENDQNHLFPMILPLPESLNIGEQIAVEILEILIETIAVL